MTDSERDRILAELKGRAFGRAFEHTDASGVITKSGDQGQTFLMFERSVEKWHPRIRLLGRLDLLSSHLTLAKCGAPERERHLLNRIHDTLVCLMGEVATEESDLPRYRKFFHTLGESEITFLEQATSSLEEGGTLFTGWVAEITEPRKAHLDVARAFSREAESMAWELVRSLGLRVELAQWLNRLADCLWALARSV